VIFGIVYLHSADRWLGAGVVRVSRGGASILSFAVCVENQHKILFWPLINSMVLSFIPHSVGVFIKRARSAAEMKTKKLLSSLVAIQSCDDVHFGLRMPNSSKWTHSCVNQMEKTISKGIFFGFCLASLII